VAAVAAVAAADPAGSPVEGGEAMSEPNDQREDLLVTKHVDRGETGPTEADEQQVLEELYGEPDAEGVYGGRAE
jgi:hypothetical protein